jgi:uncharacterized membrane protein YvbJ
MSEIAIKLSWKTILIILGIALALIAVGVVGKSLYDLRYSDNITEQLNGAIDSIRTLEQGSAELTRLNKDKDRIIRELQDSTERSERIIDSLRNENTKIRGISSELERNNTELRDENTELRRRVGEGEEFIDNLIGEFTSDIESVDSILELLNKCEEYTRENIKILQEENN